MGRRSAVVAYSAALLTAAWLPAQQPQPVGMLSPTRPIYLTNDGVPDGVGDLPATIIRNGTGNNTTFLLDFAGVDCNGQTQYFADGAPGAASPKIDEFGRGAGTEVNATNLDTSDPTEPRPTRGHYDQLGQGQIFGDFDLVDDNGDHRYERATVNGDNGGTPVQADLDLVPADTDGDSLPDYVTLSNLQPLNFFGLNCSPGGNPTNYDQIWLPLAREDNGELAVIGDLDGNNVADPTLLWGPRLDLGQPPPSGIAIPTMSRYGIAFLTLALLGLGVHLLRRRQPAAGA